MNALQAGMDIRNNATPPRRLTDPGDEPDHGRPKIARRFGANDVDGTVVEETIYHMAGATTPQSLSVREIQKLIREAGRTPVRRNTLYEEVKASDAA